MPQQEINDLTADTAPTSTMEFEGQLTGGGASRKVTGENLAQAVGGAWDTYSPTWGSVTVGDGTETAYYEQRGKTVRAQVHVDAGGTTSYGDAITVSLPVTASTRYGSLRYQVIGSAATHNSGVAAYFGWVYIDNSTSTASIRWNDGTATGSTTFPYTEGSADDLSVTFEYEAA